MLANIRIYQINIDRDKLNLAFDSFEMVERLSGTTDINKSIYDLAYEGSVSAENLEEIYTIFNIQKPKDFSGRSLSVSDVVEVISSETMKKGFYFCDTFGFQKVNFEEAEDA